MIFVRCPHFIKRQHRKFLRNLSTRDKCLKETTKSSLKTLTPVDKIRNIGILAHIDAGNNI
jgi:hypothetical protein